MKIIMTGISYQTSSVKIREQVSFSNQSLEEAYLGLKNIKGIQEVLILNTCNRTEVYAYVSQECTSEIILDYLIWFHNLESSYKQYFYHYKNHGAVEHLYKVATGLRSMVIGEDQILGQVKTAYEKAIDMNMTGKVFNTLFRDVITGSKKIRTRVMGNNPPLSISSIAVKFIRQNIPGFKDQKVFVLGVGKMSTITIQNLISEGVKEIFVANRTKHKARQLKTFFPQIKVIDYNKRLEVMAQSSVIISSTSAPHYIVTKEMFEPFYKGGEVCFIDLSLPRDIDPSLSKIKGINIFTLDDLQQVSDLNMGKRQRQAKKAEEALKLEQNKFWDWYRCQPIMPTIASLQAYYKDIAEEEIESLMGRLEHLNEKDRQLIRTVSNSMARRLFNSPILQMKEYAKNGDSQVVSQVIEDLFELPIKN